MVSGILFWRWNNSNPKWLSDVAGFTWQGDPGPAGTPQPLASVSPVLSACQLPAELLRQCKGWGAREMGRGRMGPGPASRRHSMPQHDSIAPGHPPTASLAMGPRSGAREAPQPLPTVPSSS